MEAYGKPGASIGPIAVSLAATVTRIQEFWRERRSRAASVSYAAHLRNFGNGFPARETRHNFVIETLPKSGWRAPQPYRYTCMRCKWSFRVNDRPGSIIPLDASGMELPEPARTRRIETFAQGPCPAFSNFATGARTHATNPLDGRNSRVSIKRANRG